MKARKIGLCGLSLLLIMAMLLTGCSKPPEPTPEDPVAVEPPIEEEPVAEPIVEQAEPELSAAFMAMIDNQRGARPQDGLAQADVVYEFILEADITRFMVLFYSQDPGRLGPLRSIRYYFLQIAKAYNLPLAHVGGNMDAMALRETMGIKSVCAITNAGSTFFSDQNRKSPHSTYTNTEKVLALATRRGYSPLKPPDLPLGDAKADGLPTPRVDVTYGSANKVAWLYDEEEGFYRRLHNGEPHPTMDGAAVVTHNLVIIEVPTRMVDVPIDKVQSEMNVLSSGKALFLREGELQRGTWRKKSPESHFEYFYEDGQPVAFAPGKLWVSQVHSISKNVKYE